MGENELSLFMDFMDRVTESVEIMKDSVNLYCSDSGTFPQNGQDRIKRVEREADEIKQEIIRNLMESDSSSDTKSDLSGLLFSSDEISENARAAVVKLSFLGLCDPTEGIRTDLREMTDYASKVMIF